MPGMPVFFKVSFANCSSLGRAASTCSRVTPTLFLIGGVLGEDVEQAETTRQTNCDSAQMKRQLRWIVLALIGAPPLLKGLSLGVQSLVWMMDVLLKIGGTSCLGWLPMLDQKANAWQP